MFAKVHAGISHQEDGTVKLTGALHDQELCLLAISDKIPWSMFVSVLPEAEKSKPLTIGWYMTYMPLMKPQFLTPTSCPMHTHTLSAQVPITPTHSTVIDLSFSPYRLTDEVVDAFYA